MTASMVASSSREMQSHNTLPAGVQGRRRADPDQVGFFLSYLVAAVFRNIGSQRAGGLGVTCVAIIALKSVMAISAPLR